MPEPPSLRYACNMRHPMNARSPRTGTVARQPAIYTRDVAGRHPRIPVDLGVRGGAVIFKALALGATTVGLGRPYAYGLAVAGKADVGEVIANLAVDFELTMALAGCADGAAIHGGAARLMAGD